ncbi:MAG: GreA/GreB family elongation factor, partial [Schwartzia sp.]|nr:GreA/GreB family elongation factor [Schwartzia sp. (in: firmicutes)]
AFIEGRIQELTVKLRNVELIPEDKKKKSVVSIGCHVIVRDLEFEEDLEYALVGSAEADPANGKISNESPVGAAILGHKVGETVAVHAPAGVLEYKIMKIKK